MNKELYKILSDIITIVGVPTRVSGFKYLRDAIVFCIGDSSLARSLTKNLYPLVAKNNCTTSTCVERAIRHAIDVGYNTGKMSNINNIFGLEIFDRYYKPTNGEFISLVADRLALKGYEVKK